MKFCLWIDHFLNKLDIGSACHILLIKFDINTSSGDKKQANNGMSPSGIQPYGDIPYEAILITWLHLYRKLSFQYV